MRFAVQTVSAVLLVGALVTPRLRWRRTAFVAFVAPALASFALRAGWPGAALTPTPCEGLVGAELALHSFRNTPHVILFARCFVLARAQFGAAGAGGRVRWSRRRGVRPHSMEASGASSLAPRPERPGAARRTEADRAGGLT